MERRPEDGRRAIAVALAAAGWLATAPSAGAGLDRPAQQVQIESRIVSVSLEAMLPLGVTFDASDYDYSSTGRQEPASGHSLQTGGLIGGGIGVVVTPNPGGDGPFGTGPLELGISSSFLSLFGNDATLVHISRHQPVGDEPDVLGEREIPWLVDVVASLGVPFRIPALATRPSVTKEGGILLIVEPVVGISIIEQNLQLRSDQTGFGGDVLATSDSDVGVGPVLGIGVKKQVARLPSKVPLFGDIPILAGLFYRARLVPSHSVKLASDQGFTEKLRSDDEWQHQIMIVITARIVRTGE
jgi:hypothetical protein